MRPGLVFLGLSVLLAVEYKGLADTLPLAVIFVVQFATVLVLLAVALWWRRRKQEGAAGQRRRQEKDDNR